MASYALQTPPRVAHAKPPRPKDWGKQIFSLGSFPEVGQKEKMKGKGKGETESW